LKPLHINESVNDNDKPLPHHVDESQSDMRGSKEWLVRD